MESCNKSASCEETRTLHWHACSLCLLSRKASPLFGLHLAGLLAYGKSAASSSLVRVSYHNLKTLATSYNPSCFAKLALNVTDTSMDTICDKVGGIEKEDNLSEPEMVVIR